MDLKSFKMYLLSNRLVDIPEILTLASGDQIKTHGGLN
jgi:hypothetical protein